MQQRVKAVPFSRGYHCTNIGIGFPLHPIVFAGASSPRVSGTRRTLHRECNFALPQASDQLRSLAFQLQRKHCQQILGEPVCLGMCEVN